MDVSICTGGQGRVQGRDCYSKSELPGGLNRGARAGRTRLDRGCGRSAGDGDRVVVRLGGWRAFRRRLRVRLRHSARRRWG